MTMTKQASQSDTLFAIIIIFPILATIAVTLRFYTRFILTKSYAMDDFFAILAFVLSLAMSICMGFEVANGMGRHIVTLTKVELVACFKGLFASIIFYNLGLVSIKLSMIFQYLRVCVTAPERRACYVLLAFLICFGIASFFASIFQCTPVEYFWNSKIPGGTCVNKKKLYFANAGLNIASDIALFVLPMFILRHLMVPWSQKVATAVLLAFGGFACIASILRLRVLYVSTKTTDLTWDKAGTVSWSTIELNVGIFCSSIATLRPLAFRFFPNAFRTQNGSNLRPGYGNSTNIRSTQKKTASRLDSVENIDETRSRSDIELGNM